jgi:predicted phage gp36 major capsid-like protein
MQNLTNKHVDARDQVRRREWEYVDALDKVEAYRERMESVRETGDKLDRILTSAGAKLADVSLDEAAKNLTESREAYRASKVAINNFIAQYGNAHISDFKK